SIWDIRNDHLGQMQAHIPNDLRIWDIPISDIAIRLQEQSNFVKEQEILKIRFEILKIYAIDHLVKLLYLRTLVDRNTFRALKNLNKSINKLLNISRVDGSSIFTFMECKIHIVLEEYDKALEDFNRLSDKRYGREFLNRGYEVFQILKNKTIDPKFGFLIKVDISGRNLQKKSLLGMIKDSVSA
ncbi:5727_t:CDS:2, partial [Funneliformis caledonium]